MAFDTHWRVAHAPEMYTRSKPSCLPMLFGGLLQRALVEKGERCSTRAGQCYAQTSGEVVTQFSAQPFDRSRLFAHGCRKWRDRQRGRVLFGNLSSVNGCKGQGGSI